MTDAMGVVESVVRAMACAVVAGLVATEAAAAPLVANTVADAGARTEVVAPWVSVADVCAAHVGSAACDQHGLGELLSLPMTLFDGFAAQAAEAAGAVGPLVDLQAKRPVAWAFVTAAMAASGTPTRLTLSTATRFGAADAETTLIADVAGMVRQVPEPTAFGLLLTGLAIAGGRVGRARVRR